MKLGISCIFFFKEVKRQNHKQITNSKHFYKEWVNYRVMLQFFNESIFLNEKKNENNFFMLIFKFITNISLT